MATLPTAENPQNPKDEPAIYQPASDDMIAGIYKNLRQDVIYITGDRAYRYLEPGATNCNMEVTGSHAYLWLPRSF
jgi:hypothetical protein